jgi:hypothetical protein
MLHAAPNLSAEAGTKACAFNVVAHAAVGCGSAVASGQQCGPSALAGGVTSAAGPVIDGHGFVFGLVANTALGGGVAVLGVTLVNRLGYTYMRINRTAFMPRASIR